MQPPHHEVASKHVNRSSWKASATSFVQRGDREPETPGNGGERLKPPTSSEGKPSPFPSKSLVRRWMLRTCNHLWESRTVHRRLWATALDGTRDNLLPKSFSYVRSSKSNRSPSSLLARKSRQAKRHHLRRTWNPGHLERCYTLYIYSSLLWINDK